MEEAPRASLVDALPYYDSKEGYLSSLLLFVCFLFFVFCFFFFFLFLFLFTRRLRMQDAVARELAVELQLSRRSPEDFIAHLPAVPELKFEVGSFFLPSLLPSLASFFSQGSVFLATEFNRIRAGIAPVKFSTRRVKVAAPEKETDVTGWEAALAGAEAEHGYLRGRLLQLQLQKKYGKDAWVAHNDLVAHNAAFVERELEETRIEVNEVNLARKREHGAAGKRLDRLEARYHSLKNDAEAVAKEVERIKRQKKQ